MIPRYQRILFWSLIACILLMGAFLMHGCREAHKRLTALNDATPIAAPTTAATGEVTLYMASDADASLRSIRSQVALPQDPSLRARVLLEHLLTQYSANDSAHHLQSGPSVDDVFFLTDSVKGRSNKTILINLHSSFADNHPSGIEAEELTLDSILATLHAAFPEYNEARFLVDGQPRETLAGHISLNRAYPLNNIATHATAPSEEATQP
ncbi:GerMN domain-containing protein [Edaphobacter albus]|uniref:GerMN domain-containing protein n=1 Tax=Edaphobacter sp. 4G125 TaxID=2763071 RepID=UPI0016454FDE|nr:GerMN domain-containing protein [Edaphobacter sp. 4G125]QNI38052.1 GerMN domain-containing protein [Edaphobacter sp. 4G125]